MTLLRDLELQCASLITFHALARGWVLSEPCPGSLSPPSPGGQGASSGKPASACLCRLLAWLPSTPDSAGTEQSSTRRSVVTDSAWTFILRSCLCSGSFCLDKAVGVSSRGGSCFFPLTLDPAKVIFIVRGHTLGAQPFSSAPAVSHLPACQQTQLLTWAPVPLPCVPKHPSTLLPQPACPCSGYTHGCVASEHRILQLKHSCKQGFSKGELMVNVCVSDGKVVGSVGRSCYETGGSSLRWRKCSQLMPPSIPVRAHWLNSRAYPGEWC